MRPTSAGSSGPTRSRRCRTGAGCRSVDGRAGTIVLSGTEIVRPSGQAKAPDATAPTFGPSRRLDFEPVPRLRRRHADRLGEPVPVEAFADHCPAWCSSTTGARATCRPGSTSRSAPSSGVVRNDDRRLGDAAGAARGRPRGGAAAGAPAASAPRRRSRPGARHRTRGRANAEVICRRMLAASTGRCRSSSRTRPRTAPASARET